MYYPEKGSKIDNLEFSPYVTTGSGRETAPLAGANVALKYHTLTKTAAPEYATPTAVGSAKNNSNSAGPTEGPAAIPILPTNSNSDVMSMASSEYSDIDSYYVKLRKTLPMRSANTPELTGLIQKLH